MWQAEFTDTFGGTANYSWVRRADIEGECKAKTALRRARRALGLTGLRGRIAFNDGDIIEWRPYNMACVLFVVWN
jgi:hypothetical protein